ncbi:MAG: hypothetical protein QOH96_599 [Blastocatellia bacterium]|nr:hypothetical protein [Blastocatellia bacterium]
MLVFAVLVLSSNLVLKFPERHFGVDPNETQIELAPGTAIDELRRVAIQADGGWLYLVAQNGYDPGPFDASKTHNWAFLPLYPMLWRALAFVTGGYALTGLALSTILLFFALLVVHKTALAFIGDEVIANRAVLYMAIFPLSYFYSLPRTESLFLLLTASTFLAAKTERWAAAGVLGALASLTRVNGIFLLPTVLILFFEIRRSFKPEARLLWLLLMPAGLVGHMLFLKGLTGNSFAFLDVQVAWGHTSRFFLGPLVEYVESPGVIIRDWDLRALNFIVAVLVITCGIILARRKEWAFAFFTIVCIITPLSAAAPNSLQSIARYGMVLFPVFFVLARAGTSRLFDQTLQTAFIMFLGILTVCYGLMLTFAMS